MESFRACREISRAGPVRFPNAVIINPYNPHAQEISMHFV